MHIAHIHTLYIYFDCSEPTTTEKKVGTQKWRVCRAYDKRNGFHCIYTLMHFYRLGIWDASKDEVANNIIIIAIYFCTYLLRFLVMKFEFLVE